MANNYKIIDIDTWNRKSQYLWFNSFMNPTYGIDVKMDVTNLVNYSKKTKTSFFINFLYCLTVALNEVEEFRLRYVNGEVRLYDYINPTYTSNIYCKSTGSTCSRIVPNRTISGQCTSRSYAGVFRLTNCCSFDETNGLCSKSSSTAKAEESHEHS